MARLSSYKTCAAKVDSISTSSQVFLRHKDDIVSYGTYTYHIHSLYACGDVPYDHFNDSIFVHIVRVFDEAGNTIVADWSADLHLQLDNSPSRCDSTDDNDGDNYGDKGFFESTEELPDEQIGYQERLYLSLCAIFRTYHTSTVSVADVLSWFGLSSDAILRVFNRLPEDFNVRPWWEQAAALFAHCWLETGYALTR